MLPSDGGGVAFDLDAMDRLARELDTAAGLLAESAVALGRELSTAGVSTEPARTLGEVSSWCHASAEDVRRRARLARQAQVPVPPVAPPAPPAQSSGHAGLRGWLSDRADDLGDAVHGATGAVSHLAGDVRDGAGDLLDAAGGWTVDAWQAGGRALDDLTDQAADTFDDVVHWASRTAGDAVHWVDGALNDAGGWVDTHLAGVRSWIGDHADVLRVVGDVLSTAGKVLVGVAATVAVVSAVVGAFTGVGFLGEIPAGAIATVGFVLWGAGDGLGTAADWGEGKIDGRGLLTGVVVDVVSALAVGKVLKVAGKVLEPFAPRIRRFVEDLVRRHRGGGPVPDLPPLPGRPGTPDLPHVPHDPSTPDLPPGVRPEPLPGLDHPLRGGTKDDPFRYGYTNPAQALEDAAKPTAREIARLGRHDAYAPGTPEHMQTAWRDYLERKRREGRPAQSWERWRNVYVRNQGNAAQGRAYERAFRDQQGFDPADGWQWPEGSRVPKITTPSGKDRAFDLVDPSERIAYELKSGATIDKGQLAKDTELVAAHWEVTYVFGREPSAAVRARLEAVGVRVEVWLGTPVPTR